MKIILFIFSFIVFNLSLYAQSMCGTTDEGGTVTLTAPVGNIFTSITFASYGTPDGTCGSFTIGACNAANSVSIVQAALIGNNSGSVGANNGVFGDPCGGTFKRLYIEAAYSSALPLKLISFSGTANGNINSLQWETTNEINTGHFEIQRSSDGNQFSTISTVIANNRSGSNHYSYTDYLLQNTTQFYRLKMIDQDGSFVYSNIIKLESSTSGRLTIYPNPGEDLVTISGLQNKGTVQISNMQGEILRKLNITAQTQTINIENLPVGIYILKYMYDRKVVLQKIVKQ